MFERLFQGGAKDGARLLFFAAALTVLFGRN